MGTPSTAVASILVLAFLHGLGGIPVAAQTPSQTSTASVLEELIVDGKEAAFIGSEPAAILPSSDIPDDIGRPSADDLSNLIPVTPGNAPSISLPDVDTDVDDMIIPPATGTPVPAQASQTLPPWPFDKMEGIAPLLISDAEVVSTGSDAERTESMTELTGRLAIEEHPVARRKMLRRWVLKTDSGERVPLTLNFQLLSAVKKPGIPDETVKVTGKWTTSASEPRLKYLTADRIETVAPMGSGTSDIASGASEIASGASDIATGSVDVGSTTTIVSPHQKRPSDLDSASDSSCITTSSSPTMPISSDGASKPLIASGALEAAPHLDATGAVAIWR